MSRFVEAFKTLEEKLGAPSKLGPELLFVRVLKQEDVKKLASGLYAPTTGSKQINSITSSTPLFCEVLRVGPAGYVDDDGKDVELPYTPGDIVVVGQNAALIMSSYGELIGTGEMQFSYIKTPDILEHFPGKAAYDEQFKFLNERLSGATSE